MHENSAGICDSLVSPDEIMARIAQVRTQGYEVIDQEVELGLRSIAVPLYSAHGRVMTALQTELDDLKALYVPGLLKIQDGLRRLL